MLLLKLVTMLIFMMLLMVDFGDGFEDDDGFNDDLCYNRCYIKSSLTGTMVEFPGTESGPKPCKTMKG